LRSENRESATTEEGEKEMNAPHIPSRQEVLDAGYPEGSVDSIIAGAEMNAALYAKAAGTATPADLEGAAELLNRYGNVGRDPKDLLKHKPRPDQLATACGVALDNGVPSEAVKASYVLFMEASGVQMPEAGELFENAMRGRDLVGVDRRPRQPLDHQMTGTQIHFVCPQCKAPHTVLRAGLQSHTVTCACGCVVDL
jgi:hypothetical protein